MKKLTTVVDVEDDGVLETDASPVVALVAHLSVLKGYEVGIDSASLERRGRTLTAGRCPHSE